MHIRQFDGDPKMYKEWKREIQLGALIHGLTEDKLAGLLYLALAPGPGKPRDLFSHFGIQDLYSAEGLAELWKVLDREYIKEPYVQTDEAQARYERCRRTAGQPMKTI